MRWTILYPHAWYAKTQFRCKMQTAVIVKRAAQNVQKHGGDTALTSRPKLTVRPATIPALQPNVRTSANGV